MAFPRHFSMNLSKIGSIGGRSNIRLFLLISLTLGLAPFYPEPHIIGKVKWLIGGAVGMQPMDWFDLLLHASPWVLLFGTLVLQLKVWLATR